mmetsp:Transcript_41580/g.64899  ORF Transcript_41580/g.64899 Transcript_41580/m.64899 type:complete len:201 (+) Transcript_41580:388-990(+)
MLRLGYVPGRDKRNVWARYELLLQKHPQGGTCGTLLHRLHNFSAMDVQTHLRVHFGCLPHLRIQKKALFLHCWILWEHILGADGPVGGHCDCCRHMYDNWFSSHRYCKCYRRGIDCGKKPWGIPGVRLQTTEHCLGWPSSWKHHCCLGRGIHPHFYDGQAGLSSGCSLPAVPHRSWFHCAGEEALRRQSACKRRDLDQDF